MEKVGDCVEERVREMIERVKKDRERENHTDIREWSKYLQLTDLCKWITCPVSAVGAKRG